MTKIIALLLWSAVASANQLQCQDQPHMACAVTPGAVGVVPTQCTGSTPAMSQVNNDGTVGCTSASFPNPVTCPLLGPNSATGRLAFCNSSGNMDFTDPVVSQANPTLLNATCYPSLPVAAGTAWNSSTSLNSTQSVFTASSSGPGSPSVLINLTQTTTLTGGAVTIEVSFDGTTWVTAPTNAVVDPTSSSFAVIGNPYTFQASTNKPFLVLNAGWQAVRVRLSVVITGSGSVTPNFAQLPFTPPAAAALSGTVTANQGAPNSAANSWQVEVTDGTNVLGVSAHPVRTDPTGTTTQPVSGTVTANAGSGTFTVSGTVTANAGTGNMGENLTQVAGNGVSTAASGTQKVGISGNTGAAMDAAGQNVAQPANELLTGCEFNTSPTTITTGNMSPLQCSAAARLLVDGSGVTQPVSGTVTANEGGAPWTVNNTPQANVADVSATGTLSGSGQTVTLALAGQATAQFVTTANTATNTVTFEGSNDSGSNYSPLTVFTESGILLGQALTTLAGGATVPALYTASVAGLTNVRVRMSAFTSGSQTWVVRAGSGATPPLLGSGSVVGVTQAVSPWGVNLNQVGGNATATAATGTQKVGITGNTGAAMDAAGQNASSPANELLGGCQFNTSPTTITSGNMSPVQCSSLGHVLDDANITQVAGNAVVNGGANGSLAVGGTVAQNTVSTQNPLLAGAISQATGANPGTSTAGRLQQLTSDVTGNLFVRPGSANIWNCSLNALAASLTQCQAAAAAGFKLYISTITVVTTTSTAGTYQIEYGTGTNCATGTTTLYPSFAGTWTAPVTGAPQVINFTTPLGAGTAAAICVIGTATNTINIQIQGFTAP